MPKVDIGAVSKLDYYMAMAASGPDTEILQSDWLISGRIFPALTTQGRLKKASVE